MNKYLLKDFIGGWFIGNFKPTIYKTKDFEIAVKNYKSGDKDYAHYHKIAQEYTVIISGKFKINGGIYSSGEIIYFEAKDVSHFECLENGSTAVIKIPSVIDDKYIVKNDDKK